MPGYQVLRNMAAIRQTKMSPTTSPRDTAHPTTEEAAYDSVCMDRPEELLTPKDVRRECAAAAGRRSGLSKLERTGLREMLRAVYRITLPILPTSLHRVLWNYLLFFRDLRRYRSMPGAESIRWIDLYPCLYDRCPTTPLDLNYFLQDTWAARKIFEARPKFHVDIGSTALLVGILAQFTRVCSVDIRPLNVEVPGLEVRPGSIVALPFEDGSLESVSSLCVIEHIGLGRYGDPLDPRGTDRAAEELQRVLSPGGNLYISVPISRRPRVFFNAHRSFRHEDILAKFSTLALREAVFIQWGKRYLIEDFDKIPFEQKEVVGLYHFRKIGMVTSE